MAVAKKLINYLVQQKIKYDLVEHRKVFTALDSVATQKLKPQAVVKTLVLKADKAVILALLPANRNLNKAKFKKLAKAKKVDFAKEAWMKKNLLGKVGATPAFGKLLKLPLYMDRGLLKLPDLFVNSGEYTESIKLKTKQFIKIEQPVMGSFSEAKKQ